MSNVQMSIIIDNNSLILIKNYSEIFGSTKSWIQKTSKMARENENLVRKDYAPGIQVGNNS